ncbi:hypothetical protein J8273_7352 [Carpediemonas membranifera]|uniref:Uncharacterized protein n=1 Tax=Carpediemonas membranifera TaxID=201153 RepID=A0A8J6AQI8_9EUKA|nr:hypothetical protein J8273_7352 [Carpediemonas membranifera]|eukprot:KAG9391078.1 hypothetical protein J8273_7352 [Carpediemonas membranifera]
MRPEERKQRERALIAVYCIAREVSFPLPKLVLQLIREAYSCQFHKNMPFISDDSAFTEYAKALSVDDFLCLLSSLLAHQPEVPRLARSSLHRAIRLTVGSEQSMNVELADGEDLPEVLHTLIQGTLWAILMEAGANPDLDGTRLLKKIGEQFCPKDKCIWFLCRKFFFTWNVADRNGDLMQRDDLPAALDCNTTVMDRYSQLMYSGRLFMASWLYGPPKFTRARLPRVRPGALSHGGSTHCGGIIAQTAKGLWTWGHNAMAGSRMPLSLTDMTQPSYVWFVQTPVRLTFPTGSSLASYEASLPAWHKDRMVLGLAFFFSGFIVLTPAGVAVHGFEGLPRTETAGGFFNQLKLPHGFVPDHILGPSPIVLTMGDRQMIFGPNDDGQLGLGYKRKLSAFDKPTRHIDQVVTSESNFNIYRHGHQLTFAGKPPAVLWGSSLLPKSYQRDTARVVPLIFPCRPVRLYCQQRLLVWVGTDGLTRCTLESCDDPYTGFAMVAFLSLPQPWDPQPTYTTLSNTFPLAAISVLIDSGERHMLLESEDGWTKACLTTGCTERCGCPGIGTRLVELR